jgi:hypothetical protein
MKVAHTTSVSSNTYLGVQLSLKISRSMSLQVQNYKDIHSLHMTLNGHHCSSHDHASTLFYSDTYSFKHRRNCLYLINSPPMLGGFRSAPRAQRRKPGGRRVNGADVAVCKVLVVGVQGDVHVAGPHVRVCIGDGCKA